MGPGEDFFTRIIEIKKRGDERKSSKRAKRRSKNRLSCSCFKKSKSFRKRSYTEINSKVEEMPRRSPDFEPSLAALKTAKLQKFGHRGGLKSSGFLTDDKS